jgi:hypothetical protein
LAIGLAGVGRTIPSSASFFSTIPAMMLSVPMLRRPCSVRLSARRPLSSPIGEGLARAGRLASSVAAQRRHSYVAQQAVDEEVR